MATATSSRAPFAVVELRFCGGIALKEPSRILERPQRSLERDWHRARAFLLAEIEP